MVRGLWSVVLHNYLYLWVFIRITDLSENLPTSLANLPTYLQGAQGARYGTPVNWQIGRVAEWQLG